MIKPSEIEVFTQAVQACMNGTENPIYVDLDKYSRLEITEIGARAAGDTTVRVTAIFTLKGEAFRYYDKEPNTLKRSRTGIHKLYDYLFFHPKVANHRFTFDSYYSPTLEFDFVI